CTRLYLRPFRHYAFPCSAMPDGKRLPAEFRGEPVVRGQPAEHPSERRGLEQTLCDLVDDPLRSIHITDRSPDRVERMDGLVRIRSEEHTSELQSRENLVC